MRWEHLGASKSSPPSLAQGVYFVHCLTFRRNQRLLTVYGNPGRSCFPKCRAPQAPQASKSRHVSKASSKQNTQECIVHYMSPCTKYRNYGNPGRSCFPKCRAPYKWVYSSCQYAIQSSTIQSPTYLNTFEHLLPNVPRSDKLSPILINYPHLETFACRCSKVYKRLYDG